MSRSALGMIWARCLIASRSVASLAPSYGAIAQRTSSPGHNATLQQKPDSTTMPSRTRSGSRTIHQPPYFVFSAGNLEGR